MNVQQYWEKRNTEREAYWLNVSEETFEKDLERLYARSLQHMKTQINALYGRFASQNGLSIQEATKLLTGSEYRVWRMDIEDYVNKIKAGEEGLKKELNTLAMRSRISRVEKLYSETLMQLDELGRSTSSGMKKLLTDAYEDNYYHQAYDLGKAGIKLPTKMLDESGVEEVLMTPWSGKNYSQRIWKNQRKLANTLKDTIFNGVHRGISVEKMTADVMARMDVSHSDAIRLVRTELNYVTNKGNLNSLNEAGMKYYRFVATLDSRTSATCRAHDGKVYPVTDGVQGYNVPPLHPHCRSIIVGELKGYDRSNNTREARVNGKTIDVPSTMTYEDFKAVYVDKTKSMPVIRAVDALVDAKAVAEWKDKLDKAKAEYETKNHDLLWVDSDLNVIESKTSRNITRETDYEEWLKEYDDVYNVLFNKGKLTDWMKEYGYKKKELPDTFKRYYEPMKPYVDKLKEVLPKYKELKEAVPKLKDAVNLYQAELNFASAEGKTAVEKVKWIRKNLKMQDFSDFDMIVMGREIKDELELVKILKKPEKLKQTLSEVRDMGGKIPTNRIMPGSDVDIINELNDAFHYCPTDWSRKITGENLYIKTGKTDRGFFTPHIAEEIDGHTRVFPDAVPNGSRGFSIFSTGKRATTPFHEIGHYVEWVNPDAGRLSRAFVERRTRGEEEIQLIKLFPSGEFSQFEVTKKDSFISPYIGKTYNDASEVLSMGLESVFVDDEQVASVIWDKEIQNFKPVIKTLKDDEEFLNFIIGMLVGV